MLIDDDPIVGLGSIRIGKETPATSGIVIAENTAALPAPFHELIFLVCVSFHWNRFSVSELLSGNALIPPTAFTPETAQSREKSPVELGGLFRLTTDCRDLKTRGNSGCEKPVSTDSTLM